MQASKKNDAASKSSLIFASMSYKAALNKRHTSPASALNYYASAILSTMILSDWEIRARCMGNMVENYSDELINPASLDVRLGDMLLIESVESPAMVPYPLAGHTQDNPYLLVPGQFVLAHTVETFNLPDDIAAQFMLKSSRAREGLEHLMAGYCDPGWHGSKLTMELHNSRQLHPVALWPEMKIGQIVFHKMSSTPHKTYAVTGRYNFDSGVTASKG
jgi:dCTP deaminase